MIRGRTRRTGELDFYDDTAPATVVASVTPGGITGATGGTVTTDDISDAGAFGKTMVQADSNGDAQLLLGITTLGSTIIEAVDGPAVRTAIGAGTSSTTGTVTSVNGQAPTSGAVTVSAANITTGVLPIAQVPTGATATTVSLGNHTHTVSQVTDLTAAKLLTGTAPAINNQATDFADLAAVTVAYNALLTALRTRGVITGS